MRIAAATVVLALGMAQAGAATVQINIQGMQFGPGNQPVTVNAGDTVRWTNFDSVTHTVTSGANRVADGTFDTFLLNGQSFSRTYTEAGTFPYFCRPHANMVSSIVVTPSAPTPVRGDINGDGKTDFEDLPMCLRVMCGTEMLPHGALDRMDVVSTEGEAVFDIRDVVRIVRFVLEADTTPL